ncbi:MAG TPA: MATE family efflux transporter, partial [Firmicutes bacterium]|nr:MATE family efflux transporter [Bacillota bacterium]
MAATEQAMDHPIVGAEGELSRRQAQAKILNLAYPAIIEQLLVTLVSMADMIMVGGLGASAIAAVGLSNQPIFTANAIFSAISIGSTALIARLMGAQDYRLANRAARQSLILAVSASLVLMVGVFFFAPAMIHFMRAEADVAPLAITYSRIMGVSLVFSLTSMILNGVLRGAGDMRTPMRVNVVANVINIVLNYFLIFGVGPFPRLGVAGAAVATLISHMVAFGLVLSVFFSGRFVLNFKRGQSYRPDWELIKRILNVGLPASLEQLIMRFGMMLYARTVSSLGTISYAA